MIQSKLLKSTAENKQRGWLIGNVSQETNKKKKENRSHLMERTEQTEFPSSSWQHTWYSSNFSSAIILL